MSETRESLLKALAAELALSQLDGADLSQVVTQPVELTLDEGLGTQVQLLRLKERRGETIGGWKVGMTSGAARNRMGEDFRPFGHVMNSRLFHSGDKVELALLPQAGLETEIGFLFREGIFGEVQADDILGVIEGAVPAFEIQQSRLQPNPPHGLQVADNLSHWGIVVGDVVPWETTAADTVVTIWRDGKELDQVGPNYSIDEPIESLARLVTTMSRFGLGIEAGQYVITGAFWKASIDAPANWKASFSGLGYVEVRIQ